MSRSVLFYPISLEKGQRSERALKLAIAEMYVQGATTRKITAVTCTSRITIYTAAIANCLMVNQLVPWLRNLSIDRDLSFNLLASELTTV